MTSALGLYQYNARRELDSGPCRLLVGCTETGSKVSNLILC